MYFDSVDCHAWTCPLFVSVFSCCCCSDLSVFLLFDCKLRNIRSTIQRSRKMNYLCLPPQSVFFLISQQIFAIKILSYDFMISTTSIVMTKYTFSTSKYWTKINDLIFFRFSLVIFVKQESEIVEVLWKQDVDLGYTLAPPAKIGSPKDAAANSSGLNTDESEKLKALQELKRDKVCKIQRISMWNSLSKPAPRSDVNWYKKNSNQYNLCESCVWVFSFSSFRLYWAANRRGKC